MPTVPPVDYGWQSEKSFLECHQHMLEEGIAYDVTFLVGKEKHEVQAHKYMLICRSSVFQTMFCGPLAEEDNIPIPDIEPDAFRALLKYMYYGNTTLSNSLTLSALYAAKKYLVGGLVKICMESVGKGIDVNNACTLIQESVDLHVPEVHPVCVEFINRNGEQCLKSESFLALNDACVKELIASDNLVANELTIWKSLVRWADSKCAERQLEINDNNRRRLLGDLVYCIRFRDMDPGIFAKNVATSSILSSDEKCEIFLRLHGVTKVLDKFSPKDGRQCEQAMSRLMRFETYKNGVWKAGKSVDAICISVSKNIYLYGIVIYRITKDTNITVTLLEGNWKSTFFSEEHVVQRPKELTSDIIFRNKILLEHGSQYIIRVDNPVDYCVYALDNGGKTEFTQDEICVGFHHVNEVYNISTNTTWGQIPGILFKHY